MSRRTIISLAASVFIGIACVATVSTDAFAYRRGGVARAGVYHGGVYRGGVYRGAAVGRGWRRCCCCRRCCGRSLRISLRATLRILSLSTLLLEFT
jgi:hypothetical protein